MDPTTVVLLYLIAGLGVSASGLGAVVAAAARANRRRKAREEARRVAIENARWEARTTLKHGKSRVQLVRVARLGMAQWVTETDDHVVEVPVGDLTGLLNAQTDAELAAKTANGDVL